jgi:flagellar biosynthesis regulator FlbT
MQIKQNIILRELQKVVQNNTILRVDKNQKVGVQISNDIKFIQSNTLNNMKEHF